MLSAESLATLNHCDLRSLHCRHSQVSSENVYLFDDLTLTLNSLPRRTWSGKNCSHCTCSRSTEKSGFLAKEFLPPRIRWKILRHWGWGSSRDPLFDSPTDPEKKQDSANSIGNCDFNLQNSYKTFVNVERTGMRAPSSTHTPKDPKLTTV